MARGFLKDVGGVKRMRFVKPGYDANNMNIPQDAVIFDSEDIGNLSIYAQDEWNSGVKTTGGTQYNDVQIASWPALPFVPLVTTQYRYGQGSAGTVVQDWTSFMDLMQTYNFRLWASESGLNLFWARDGAASIPSIIYIRWQVYRVPG